jgi:hypothetical protein
MKNAVSWHVRSCSSCKNRRFGGTYHLHHQGDKNQRARNIVGRGDCRQVIGMGFEANVKWIQYKGQFHGFGGG